MQMTPGRITGIKAGLHLACGAALLWIAAGVARDTLGADPVQALLLFCGRMAITMLLVTLAVSPVSRFLGKAALIQVRRPCGLWCFVWATLHALVFFGFALGFSFSGLVAEILQRPFLALGAAAWTIFLLMALTSSFWAIKKLQHNWKRLHRLIYVALIFAGTHYLLAGKTPTLQAKIYAGIGVALLLVRLIPKKK